MDLSQSRTSAVSLNHSGTSDGGSAQKDRSSSYSSTSAAAIQRVVRSAILNLCQDNAPYLGQIEVDGIICISGQQASEQVVVKVHEKLYCTTEGKQTDDNSQHANNNNTIQTNRQNNNNRLQTLQNNYVDKTDSSIRDNGNHVSDCSTNTTSNTHTSRPTYTTQFSIKTEPTNEGDNEGDNEADEESPADDHPSPTGLLATSPATALPPPLLPAAVASGVGAGGVGWLPPPELYTSPASSAPPSHNAAATVSALGSSYALANRAQYLNMISQITVVPECKACGFTFAQVDLLQEHNEAVHGVYTCKYCYRTFTSRSNLDRHLRLHTGQKPYACKKCGKTFSRKDHLSNHAAKHAYKCGQCHKRYSERGELSSHYIIDHHTPLVALCVLCNKGFHDAVAYTEHQKAHPGAKVAGSSSKASAVSASVTGDHSSFGGTASGSATTNGIAASGNTTSDVHPPPPPPTSQFSCAQCSYKTSVHLDLLKHKVLHNPNHSNYRCLSCLRVYSDPVEYSEHFSTHTDDINIYECCVCRQVQATLVRLRTHEQEHLQGRHPSAHHHAAAAAQHPAAHSLLTGALYPLTGSHLGPPPPGAPLIGPSSLTAGLSPGHMGINDGVFGANALPPSYFGWLQSIASSSGLGSNSEESTTCLCPYCSITLTSGSALLEHIAQKHKSIATSNSVSLGYNSANQKCGNVANGSATGLSSGLDLSIASSKHHGIAANHHITCNDDVDEIVGVYGDKIADDDDDESDMSSTECDVVLNGQDIPTDKQDGSHDEDNRGDGGCYGDDGNECLNLVKKDRKRSHSPDLLVGKMSPDGYDQSVSPSESPSPPSIRTSKLVPTLMPKRTRQHPKPSSASSHASQRSSSIVRDQSSERRMTPNVINVKPEPDSSDQDYGITPYNVLSLSSPLLARVSSPQSHVPPMIATPCVVPVPSTITDDTDVVSSSNLSGGSVRSATLITGGNMSSGLSVNPGLTINSGLLSGGSLSTTTTTSTTINEPLSCNVALANEAISSSALLTSLMMSHASNAARQSHDIITGNHSNKIMTSLAINGFINDDITSAPSRPQSTPDSSASYSPTLDLDEKAAVDGATSSASVGRTTPPVSTSPSTQPPPLAASPTPAALGLYTNNLDPIALDGSLIRTTFMCDVCGLRVDGFETYAKHCFMAHLRYPCIYCSKTFAQKANRERHMCIHTGAKPYQCRLCGERFSRGDKLKHHRIKYHPDAPKNKAAASNSDNSKSAASSSKAGASDISSTAPSTTHTGNTSSSSIVSTTATSSTVSIATTSSTISIATTSSAVSTVTTSAITNTTPLSTTASVAPQLLSAGLSTSSSGSISSGSTSSASASSASGLPLTTLSSSSAAALSATTSDSPSSDTATNNTPCTVLHLSDAITTANC